MGKANFTNVDEYIAAQPETAQVVLQLVRSTLRKALPGAEAVISYKIPAYRLHGGIVLYFAGWKQHYSLYPMSSNGSREDPFGRWVLRNSSGRRREVFGTSTNCTPARPFQSCHITTRKTDLRRLPGEFELKIHFVDGRKLLTELHSHAVLREIDQRCSLPLDIGVIDGSLRMHSVGPRLP